MKTSRSFSERLIQRVFYKFYSRNLLYELQLRARAEAADYVHEHMAKAQIFTTHQRIIEYAVKNAQPGGMYMEFGVATGNTLSEIASHAPAGATVYGFDSFSGLPDNWAGHVETTGAFSQRDIPKVPANTELVHGYFKDSLPEFIKGHDGPVSFVHIDCDLYSSTVTILKHIGPWLKPGAHVLFDEYFNYPSWKQHEHKAWREYCDANNVNYTYVGFTALDGRVLVRID